MVVQLDQGFNLVVEAIVDPELPVVFLEVGDNFDILLRNKLLLANNESRFEKALKLIIFIRSINLPLNLLLGQSLLPAMGLGLQLRSAVAVLVPSSGSQCLAVSQIVERIFIDCPVSVLVRRLVEVLRVKRRQGLLIARRFLLIIGEVNQIPVFFLVDAL